MDMHGYLWISMYTHGYQLISIDIHGDPLISTQTHGYPWVCAPLMKFPICKNLPVRTLPISSENAGGATCRRRAAKCTDISTFGAHSNHAHSNLEF